MTIRKLIKKYSTLYPDKEADLTYLLLELSGLIGSDFYLFYDKDLSTFNPTLEAEFEKKAKMFIHENIPIQHLLGYAYFYGYKFIVNSNALIPRRETQELCEHILYYFDKYFNEPIKLLDLGCGTGVIGITLKLEEPRLNVVCSDISTQALNLCKLNANAQNVNIKIIQSDWFKNIDDVFDIIVCNPPYIPKNETLSDIVLKDPLLALFGGENGIEHFQSILKTIGPKLKTKSLVAFEHGFDQRGVIHSLIEKYLPSGKVITLKDLSRYDRFTFVGFAGVLASEKSN